MKSGKRSILALLLMCLAVDQAGAGQDDPFADQPSASQSSGFLSQDAPEVDYWDDTPYDSHRTLIATAESTFFWPQFNRAPLQTTLRNGGIYSEVSSTSALGSANGNFLAAPRITLGTQGPCWSFLGRYWNASSSATAFVPTDPNVAPLGITGLDTFGAYTADLELQRRFSRGIWDLAAFGGARYAGVRNARNFTVNDITEGSLLGVSSWASQQFYGTGFTFGVMGTRPFICRCSPWSLFFANRYSILWGNGQAIAQTSAAVGDPAGFSTSTNGSLAQAAGSLFIAEVQLGFQWNADLQCLPARAFLRAAAEYQYWDSASGVRVGANSFAAGTNAATTASASAGDLLFELIGVTVGAGITY